MTHAWLGWIRKGGKGRWVVLVGASSESECWAALESARALRAPWSGVLLTSTVVLRAGEDANLVLRGQPARRRG
jgi:hypothetical protein